MENEIFELETAKAKHQQQSDPSFFSPPLPISIDLFSLSLLLLLFFHWGLIRFPFCFRVEVSSSQTSAATMKKISVANSTLLTPLQIKL